MKNAAYALYASCLVVDKYFINQCKWKATEMMSPETGQNNF